MTWTAYSTVQSFCWAHSSPIGVFLTWINQKWQITINKTQINSKILKIQNSKARPIKSIFNVWILVIYVCFIFVVCLLPFVIYAKKNIKFNIKTLKESGRILNQRPGKWDNFVQQGFLRRTNTLKLKKFKNQFSISQPGNFCFT